jgi:hypothetical protein
LFSSLLPVPRNHRFPPWFWFIDGIRVANAGNQSTTSPSERGLTDGEEGRGEGR